MWDQRDSNPRPSDYESPALPLSYGPPRAKKQTPKNNFQINLNFPITNPLKNLI